MSNSINIYEATVILPSGYQVKASAQAENMTIATRMITAQYPAGSTVMGMYKLNPDGSRGF